MRINNDIPKQFLKYQKSLKKSIKALGVTQSFVYKGIGMSKTTWDRRLKRYDFTAQELIAVCDLINGRKS